MGSTVSHNILFTVWEHIHEYNFFHQIYPHSPLLTSLTPHHQVPLPRSRAFFKKLTGFNSCFQYVQGCKTIHCNIGNSIHSENSASPLSFSQHPPVANSTSARSRTSWASPWSVLGFGFIFYSSVHTAQPLWVHEYFINHFQEFLCNWSIWYLSTQA